MGVATRDLVLIVGTILVVESGCYLSHEAPPPRREDAPPPVDGGVDAPVRGICEAPATFYTSWCCDLTDAACDTMEECCGSVSSFNRVFCNENFVRSCTEFLVGPWVQDRIAAGVIEFDPEAAQLFIEGVRRQGPACDWLNMWLAPGTLRDNVTVNGVFRGTKAPGERCDYLLFPHAAMPSECRDGFCDGELGECVAFVARGEACDRHHQCLDLDHPIVPATPTGPFGIHYAPLVPYQPGSRLPCVDSQCLDPFEVGEGCSADDDCASLYCSMGRCREPAPVGDECAAGQHCESGSCRIRLAGGTCEAGDAPHGAACTRTSQCTTHACVDRTCVSPICIETERIYSTPP